MKVKVWNDNIQYQGPYKEKFRDMDITIPSGGFIWMEEDDAKTFRRSMSPNFNYEQKHDPKLFKMIRIEKPVTEVAAPKVAEIDLNKCVACSYRAANQADLGEHVNATHAHQQVVDKEAEIALSARTNQVA